MPLLASAESMDGAQEAIVAEEKDSSLADRFDQRIAAVNGHIFRLLFFDVAGGAFLREVADPETGVLEQRGGTVPFVVAFLAFGAFFFTLYHRGIHLRGFRHSLEIVAGKYSDENDEGEVPPFRALTSALSATVGLGNIAGVALAMVIGGPGALFWMMVLGLFGMASKFHETTLALLFRVRNEDGSYSGGPMYYLSCGLGKVHPALRPVGKVMAVVAAFCLMLAALGGGNMFQANQAYEAFFSTFVAGNLGESDVEVVRLWLSYGFGLLLAVVVGFVVLGGVTRIGAATSRLVPFMAILYVLACAGILVFHLAEIPSVIALVFREAFSAQSAYGGIVGAMMMGFQRAAFSSEAGLGSSAVVHAAVKTREPVREGFVASLEPFIDTIIVCFMTGMVVLVTGAYQSGISGGAAVTLEAFARTPFLQTFMPYVLSVCIVLFAFSTMLAWCYYGERAWGYLFGIRSVFFFRLVFVFFVFVGTVATLGSVLDFADAALLSTAVPNILGGIILAPLAHRFVKKYWQSYRRGEFESDASAEH